MKEVFSTIEKNEWIKNWSGNWTATFASLYVAYATELKKYIGKNLNLNLIICEGELSYNYLSRSDLDEYCKFLVQSVLKGNLLPEKWANDTVSTAEELFRIMEKIKSDSDLTSANLLKLRNVFYNHVPPHFSMKKVIDYLPENVQKQVSPKLTEARLKTENLFNAVDAMLRKYTRHIANKTGYSSQVTEFLLIDEVLNYLDTGKILDLKELSERSNGMGLFYKNASCSVITGTDFNRLEQALITPTQELKGQVAYKGYAKGIVRIVNDPKKVVEFNDGDILVTGMTRPEFLPLMKKAAAFVTDAGGLLSHAAIIARELKKPCIIGTNTASKILKNGDLVEVDANKGIVNII